MPNIPHDEAIWLAGAWSWIWPLLLTCGYVALAVVLHRWLMLWLAQRPRRVGHLLDDLIATFLGWPLLVAMILGGLLMLFNLWPLPYYNRQFVLNGCRIAFIVLLVSFAHQFLNSLFRSSDARSWLRISLLRKVLLFSIYTVGVMMILDELGLQLTPILTALGVGSLAIALAVREILANFFAGVQLSLDRPLEIGQSVTLENGMEGEVLTIGWMKTWLRAPDGSRLLIPNAKLMGFIIRNYTLAGRGPIIQIKLTVDRQADLDKAEKLVLQAAKKVAGKPDGTQTKMEPRAQFTELTAAAAILTVTLYAENYRVVGELRSAFLKAVNESLKKAGINIA